MVDSKPIFNAVIATAASILVVSILFSATRKKKREIVQSILEKTAPVAAAEELATSGSSTCECLLNGSQMVITANAQVADYIFNGRAKNNYVRRPAVDEGLQGLGMFQRGLIWNNELPVWKKIRSCFRMALNDAALHNAVAVAKEECHALLEESASAESEVAVNLLALSRRVTFRVTLNVFFGIDSRYFESLGIREDAFIASIVAYFKAWEYFLLRPTCEWDVTTAKQHKDAVTVLHVHVEQLLYAVATHRPYSTKEANKQTRKDGLFVDHLRVTCMPEKDSLDLLQQSALEMMLAGTDTSSVTAYYALLGLAGDSTLQQELEEELSSNTKNELLDSVINETLRFKPVGPVVLREAVNADPKFPGASIEKGAAVLVHLAEMNLRDEYWQDPHTFNPRRFIVDDVFPTKPKIFFPFGEGPKGCIGMHLGRREVSAIIETVVLHYDMAIQGDTTLESLETHWDIANQPDEPPLILLSRRAARRK